MAKDTTTENIDRDILVSEASAIYRGLVSVKRGIELSALATEAFQLAVPFAREAARILNGGEIAKHAPNPGIPMVKVWVWDEAKMEPMLDEKTSKPVVAEMLGDPDSHAPKLNPAHPVNQRYWLSLMARGASIDALPPRYQPAAREYKAAFGEGA